MTPDRELHTYLAPDRTEAPHADRDRSEEPWWPAGAAQRARRARETAETHPDKGEAEIEALRAERDSLRAALDDRNRLWGHRSRELGDLRAEVERLRDKAQEAGAAYGLANSKHHAELDRANRLERLANTLSEKAVDLEDAKREAEAERDRLQAIVTAAALETYTPDGSERFVGAFHETLRRATAAEAERDRLAGVVERVRALADEWGSQSLRDVLDADAPEASEEGQA